MFMVSSVGMPAARHYRWSPPRQRRDAGGFLYQASCHGPLIARMLRPAGCRMPGLQRFPGFCWQPWPGSEEDSSATRFRILHDSRIPLDAERSTDFAGAGGNDTPRWLIPAGRLRNKGWCSRGDLPPRITPPDPQVDWECGSNDRWESRRFGPLRASSRAGEMGVNMNP